VSALRHAIHVDVEPTAVEETEDGDWTPLHPLHVGLVRRMSAYPEAREPRLPLPARTAIALGLTAASWAVVWSMGRALLAVL
jgi:hypothetical protein